MTAYTEMLVEQAREEFNEMGTIAADTFTTLAREGILVRELLAQFQSEKEQAHG